MGACPGETIQVGQPPWRRFGCEDSKVGMGAAGGKEGWPRTYGRKGLRGRSMRSAPQKRSIEDFEPAWMLKLGRLITRFPSHRCRFRRNSSESDH